MYIKQIIIQGFKSYKDQTVIEPFSPGTNVIVGRNGSGKSNFFAAIRFVLSDAYTQMSREERQALLHEGSGSAVMSAYVEIIFDNSDDRFPTGNKEVTLRRTIGLKKDEYSVDRKVVTKSDVMNLLEAAGFSRSNPYYIVPQGRVTALTNMKESDRLNLLKEVAGTQVYEARRAESLKIMNDTNNKREKIDELLDYIKERLAELEEEKEELKGYQTKDRERRCLEYAFYHREQVRVQESLDEIESSRQDNLDNSDSNRAELLACEQSIDQLDAEIRQLQRDKDLLEIERRQFDDDRRENSKALAVAELRVKDLSEGQSAHEQERTRRAEELEAIKAEMVETRAELVKLTPELNKRQKKEDDMRRNMAATAVTLKSLQNKQTNGTLYKNKAERDAALKERIDDLEMALSKCKANKLEAEEGTKRLEADAAATEQEVSSLREELLGWGDRRRRMADGVVKSNEAHEGLQAEMKKLAREDDKLEQRGKDAGQQLTRAEKELSQTMDGATARGLASIRRLKAEKEIPGAYGTLAELMDVAKGYRLPVEQIAGASLFHYVVDNADTASMLSNHLYKTRGGRVTFMPLRELRPRDVRFPRAEDAVPLIDKIDYDETYDKAFRQVFGRTIVCPSLTIAGQYARSHGVDGITPEGDTTNKRGAMTGGYINPKSSRLEAMKFVNEATEAYGEIRGRQEELKQQMQEKHQQITHAIGEMRRVEVELKRVQEGFQPTQDKFRVASKDLEKTKAALDKSRSIRAKIEDNMAQLSENLSAAEAELASDFKKTLSAAEERQLEELTRSTEEMNRQLAQIVKARMDADSKKQLLEIDLNQNLQPKLDQLTSMELESSSTGGSDTLKEAQRELKKAQKAASSIRASLDEAEASLDEQQRRIEELQAERAEQDQRVQEVSALIEKQQKRLERNLGKKSLLVAQAADCAKNIRELGVLPEEAFGKYERMELKTIQSKLKKVNEALKKYKHVNKKAFEQYNSFTTQQQQLLDRRKELDASQGSIEELVEHLDRRKDEAIERTFKQVSKEFATIFEKLVPAGHGRLVIQRRADRRQEPEESDEEQRGAVENYTGVGISVSFNSKTLDEQQRIQQLSGGQKSLCALCLIFALQQTESSPMVIFDEVDANLDAQYRTAVAGLLESISKEAGTQFICTTFRPEIVHIADKCYGVTFHNKTSSIDCVSTEDALNFVEGQSKPR